MSIALPFNRLSFGTGNQASRLARSSSWLNQRRDVGRDVEALFTAGNSRSPESVAAIGAHPVASTSYLPGNAASDYPGSSERIPSAWKGKGRALPSTDATYKRETNGYVEEGQIQRPLSTFFSVNAPEHSDQGVALSGASTSAVADSAATTIRAQPLLSIDQLPQTPAEAIQFVNIVAQGPKCLSRLRSLLCSLRASPAPVRIAALSTCLAFPVVSSRDWHQRSARAAARNTVFRSGRTRAGVILDDVTFYNIWGDLWFLAGESLKIPPDVAARTLQNILSLPLPTAKKVRTTAKDSICAKSVRTLLFLAGLENNPTLAVNALGCLLHPELYHASAFAPSTSTQQSASAGRTSTDYLADVNDIALILQDLLRSGILSSKIANQFGLSEVVSQAPSMAESDFKHLLKQTLLRIILQYYIDHGEQGYVSRMTSLIEIPTGSAFQEGETFQRDVDLLLDAARSSMYQLKLDFQHADAVARILKQLMTVQGDHPAYKMNTEEREQAAAKLQHLLNDYFKVVLAEDYAEGDSPYVSRDISFLWQAIVQAELPFGAEDSLLDLPQLICLMKHLDMAKESALHDLARRTSTMLFNRLHKAIQQRQKLDNDLLNAALARFLACNKTFPPPTEDQASIVLHLYRLCRRFAVVPEGFSLQSKNLWPLIQVALSPAAAVHKVDSEDEAAVSSSSSIIDHFMRCRSSWQAVPHADYTALAGALLDNGEYDASRQVLQQLFKIKEVPSLEDVEICLRILAREHPDEARQIVEGAREEGLLVEPEIYRRDTAEAIL